MEVVIREIRIRDQIEYIVDDRDGLMPERKMKLILEALYNSLLTDSELIERAGRTGESEKIILLREVVGRFLESSEQEESEEEKIRKKLVLKEAIGQFLAS